jgi:hypothetical protein
MTSPLLELIYPPRLIREADDRAGRAEPEPERVPAAV